MNTTELFLKTVDAYKAWIRTGMDFMSFSDLYERWDAALLEYAKAMNISRDTASLHVTEAIKKDLI
jgi:hypothetical protein